MIADHNKWEPYASVFTAIQRGTLAKELDSCTDAQLEPFLPFLVTAQFGPTADSSLASPALLARLSTMSQANYILDLISIDFGELKRRLADTTQPPQPLSTFRTAEHLDKYALAIRSITDGDLSEPTLKEWLPEDDRHVAIVLVSLALFHLPDQLDINSIATRLVSFSDGAWILNSIICNFPSAFDQALGSLLEISLHEETVRGKNRAQMINDLVTLCPSLTGYTISRLALTRRDALLAVRLSALKHDDLEFIRFTNKSLIERWDMIYIALHKSSGRPVFNIINRRILSILESLIAKKNMDGNEEFLECLVLSLLQSNAKPTAAEVKLITSYLCLQIDDAAHVQAALCALLALPVLTSPSPGMAPGNNVEPKIFEYLQWLKLMAISSHEEEGANVHPVLIAALCAWSNRVEEINKFLSDCLLCRVTLASRHFAGLRSVLQSIFPEKELAQVCAAMPITPGLHFNVDGSEMLPVNWICDLLQQKVFSKHNVDVGRWIERQIIGSSTPIHPALTDAIDKLAETASQKEIGQGLSYTFCQETYAGDLLNKKLVVRRLLVLQYLLAFRLRFTALGRKEENPYKALYRNIPIRYLLSIVEANVDEYSAVRTSLVRSSLDLFPNMRPSRKSIELVRKQKNELKIPLPPDNEIATALQDDQVGALIMAKRLRKAPLSDLVRLAETIIEGIKRSLPSENLQKESISSSAPIEIDEDDVEMKVEKDADELLEDDEDIDEGECEKTVLELGEIEMTSNVKYRERRRRVLGNLLAETLCSIWLDLEAIMPRTLIEKTLTSWQKTPFMVDQAYTQPCLVFNVDHWFFASPPHFAVFLKMLTFFLETGRVEKERAVLVANMKAGQQYEEKQRQYICEEREMLFSVLDHTQRAAAVQLLIEVCDPVKNQLVASSMRLSKIRTLAFNYIHSMFIRDIQVMKLVLFETFPLRMLRPVIEGVPSMHVAQGFVQEMLVFPQVKRRIFTISLIIEIFRKYRVKATLPFVNVMLNSICTLIRAANSQQVLCLMNGVIEELAELTKVFPQMSETVLNIFGQVAIMAKTRLSLYSTALVSSKVMEKQLIKRINNESDVIRKRSILT